MSRILGVATAVPENRHSQIEIFAQAKQLFHSRGHNIAPFEKAFTNTQIESRYSAAPLDWFLQENSWRDRNSLYLTTAVGLLEKVTRESLAKSAVNADEVTDIITVSTTGIATPSLEAVLMDRFPFRSDVRRTPIFGLGCAGGLMGLHRAAEIAASDSKRVVLLLVVELCTLHFMRDELTKQNIIATALFADGAAGAVISNRGHGPKVTAMHEHRWPNSLDVMGWEVADNGLNVIFSRQIPDLVKKDFTQVYRAFTDTHRIKNSDIDRFLSHPGGAKVLDELETLFEVESGTMVDSREVLRNYGNMSAPTVLFVLERAMRKSMTGRSILTTFGPGFSSAITMLECE